MPSGELIFDVFVGHRVSILRNHSAADNPAAFMIGVNRSARSSDWLRAAI
ncbi:hypothetical protein MA6G0728R_0392 [Mycobacteroides abscessus 6G-0728-R]|nr:hypothetical protein MA6G0125R_4663 [Mycobacteroides abscessus 6G-0125-R]EIU51085.1 hypothetical protein MA6G0125S_0398 [Mycobacteroides abscessus 6G-0125-S]EIU61030.1 hypothetical protein MA6G0728S_0033 [Mycobacteroides abscessus 6G-0728-S]EIU66598.1 hypothetical protein MA6G1108_0389 [Mycobacteroides abscessus 6G-1108]EIU99175.1 hypothetical protein MA6G0212_0458 [Mycobacteroides abscessus 6G-0212]EIV02398.1 hypothetical protein MA6G0728R_0392 [Mycobacteroides abscessus 6G-0728-R]